jgi:hypothetical protein
MTDMEAWCRFAWPAELSAKVALFEGEGWEVVGGRSYGDADSELENWEIDLQRGELVMHVTWGESLDTIGLRYLKACGARFAAQSWSGKGRKRRHHRHR